MRSVWCLSMLRVGRGLGGDDGAGRAMVAVGDLGGAVVRGGASRWCLSVLRVADASYETVAMVDLRVADASYALVAMVDPAIWAVRWVGVARSRWCLSMLRGLRARCLGGDARGHWI